MKQRTEDEILTKTPIKVKLGDVEYDLKPLPIIKARAWREKLTTIMQGIVSTLAVEESQNSIGPAMAAALVAFPDKVADLVFAWAPEFPQEKILEEASEEQMTLAYNAVMVMAYPFLMPLMLTMRVTKSQPK